MPLRAVPQLLDALPPFRLRLACLPGEGNLDITGCTCAPTQHYTIKVYLVVQPWASCGQCVGVV